MDPALCRRDGHDRCSNDPPRSPFRMSPVNPNQGEPGEPGKPGKDGGGPGGAGGRGGPGWWPIPLTWWENHRGSIAFLVLLLLASVGLYTLSQFAERNCANINHLQAKIIAVAEVERDDSLEQIAAIEKQTGGAQIIQGTTNNKLRENAKQEYRNTVKGMDKNHCEVSAVPL